MAAIPENLIVGLQNSTPFIPLQSDNSLLNEREAEKNIRSKKYTELVDTYTNYVKDTAQFTQEEEKYIVEVIKNTQDFDK